MGIKGSQITWDRIGATEFLNSRLPGHFLHDLSNFSLSQMPSNICVKKVMVFLKVMFICLSRCMLHFSKTAPRLGSFLEGLMGSA